MDENEIYDKLMEIPLYDATVVKPRLSILNDVYDVIKEIGPDQSVGPLQRALGRYIDDISI